ncbi:MAG: hypothetical protein D6722_18720, partial [Bacteroidetes bacterium]
GNGMVGMGWQLSGLSYIARTQYGNGIHLNANDTFVQSDIGILVKQSDGSYHSKDESFSKCYPSDTSGNPASWTCKSRNGGRTVYGQRVGSRKWLLTQVSNSHGLSYTVSYTCPGGTCYPSVITYTKNAGAASYRTVSFSYEGRTDNAMDTDGGLSVRLTQRLKWISVRSAGALVRKYRLDYQYGSATGRSRLIAVQEYGSNGTSTLPAQTFAWQEGGSGRFGNAIGWSDARNFNGWKFGGIGDFNGDGKSDMMLYYNDASSWRANVALGDGPSPDLMTTVRNGLGSTTTVTYKPATQVANAILPARTVCSNANASPRQLVTKVTTTDGRGKTYSASFSYYNGRTYPGKIPDQANLGFEWTKQKDDNSGAYTLTHYRQDKPFEGREARSLSYAGSGALMSQT